MYLFWLIERNLYSAKSIVFKMWYLQFCNPNWFKIFRIFAVIMLILFVAKFGLFYKPLWSESLWSLWSTVVIKIWSVLQALSSESVPGSNPTRRLVGLRDPTSLRGFRWPSCRICKTQVINIRWVRLPPR